MDTTDTHTFAEYNSANRGKFGITFAYRIEDNTEQKRAAGFLLVPFEPPAERPPTVSALAQKTRWNWLWIVGTGLSSRGQTKCGKNIVVACWANEIKVAVCPATGRKLLRCLIEVGGETAATLLPFLLPNCLKRHDTTRYKKKSCPAESSTRRDYLGLSGTYRYTGKPSTPPEQQVARTADLPVRRRTVDNGDTSDSRICADG